ncbi:MAG: AMP-binding protein [Pseudanabaena sp. CRU_2_10]|nr:AMP-binding protein [Pseudanabaena sp. CRU_2_10]
MSSIPAWLSQRSLQKSGGTHPAGNRPALLFERKTWTFADLEAISISMALKLAEMGIGQGSCVAVLMANHPGYILLLHALSKLGAIAALINIRLSAKEIEWQLQDCQAQLLFYDRTTYDRASQLRSWRSLDITELEGVTTENTAFPLLTDIELEAVQAIVYTSGTTGVPKGVQLTYGNHWHSAVASAMNLGIDNSDRWLLCLPLYHVGGMAIVWRSLIYGTTAILVQRFDPEAVIRRSPPNE